MKFNKKRFAKNMSKLIAFMLIELAFAFMFIYGIETSSINEYHTALNAGESWQSYTEKF